MYCQCISQDCPADLHGDLECQQHARRKLSSRDYGEDVIWMCRMCAIDAVNSGLFEPWSEDAAD